MNSSYYIVADDIKTGYAPGPVLSYLLPDNYVKNNLLKNLSQQKPFTYGEYMMWKNLPFGNESFTFKNYNNNHN
tara:strand:+ start:230 stop:451 length:222 start_codon:yes stop_codon:yes gene_type:complete